MRIAKRLRHLILDLKLSPYAAVMKMKASGKFKWVPSERTVCYAVDSGLPGISRRQLPSAGPAGKRRRTPPRMADMKAGGRFIDERPEEAISLYFERRTACPPPNFFMENVHVDLQDSK